MDLLNLVSAISDTISGLCQWCLSVDVDKCDSAFYTTAEGRVRRCALSPSAGVCGLLPLTYTCEAGGDLDSSHPTIRPTTALKEPSELPAALPPSLPSVRRDMTPPAHSLSSDELTHDAWSEARSAGAAVANTSFLLTTPTTEKAGTGHFVSSVSHEVLFGGSVLLNLLLLAAVLLLVLSRRSSLPWPRAAHLSTEARRSAVPSAQHQATTPRRLSKWVQLQSEEGVEQVVAPGAMEGLSQDVQTGAA